MLPRATVRSLKSANHLGNVHLVLSDYRSVTGDASDNITGYHSVVSSSAEYYPFGMVLVEGEYDSESYRYGFMSFEKDDEVKGAGNHISFVDYGYDPRTGRRWNIDPATAKYPHQSPYSAFNNNPIYFLDPDGKEGIASVNHSNQTVTIRAVYFVEVGPNGFNQDNYNQLMGITDATLQHINIPERSRGNVLTKLHEIFHTLYYDNVWSDRRNWRG